MAAESHSAAAVSADRTRAEGEDSVAVVGERFADVASLVDMNWAMGKGSEYVVTIVSRYVLLECSKS